MEQSPSWKANRFSASQEIPRIFFGIRRFITAFTSAGHLSLSRASSIQSLPPHPTSRRPTVILSYHLPLGPPSDLFLSGFHTKTLYTPLLSPIRATCPAHVMIWSVRWHYVRLRSVFPRLFETQRCYSNGLLVFAVEHHCLRLFTRFLHFEVRLTDFSDLFVTLWAVPWLRHLHAGRLPRMRPFCAGFAVDSQ